MSQRKDQKVIFLWQVPMLLEIQELSSISLLIAGLMARGEGILTALC
jgi:hypothetical protein